MDLLYNYIKNMGTISRNRIGLFVAQHPECVGALEKLIEDGKVEEIQKDLFQVK